jgi:hypothetical protein
VGKLSTLLGRGSDDTHLEVVSQFLTVFTDPEFCRTVAPHVGHYEAEVIARMLDEHGGQLAAQVWMSAHIEADAGAGDDPHTWHDLAALAAGANGGPGSEHPTVTAQTGR